jgi:hypothetical protein
VPQSILWRGLDREARAHQPLFLAACARHAVLLSYPTADAVLQALADRSPEAVPAREELTCALLEELQTSKHSFWSTLLAVGFRRTICKLARKASNLPREDAEQLALLAFLDGVSNVRPGGGRTLVRLYYIVRQRIVDELHRERRWAERAVPLDDEAIGHNAVSMETGIDQARTARLLAATPPTPGESVRAYAARACARPRRAERDALDASLRHQRAHVLADVHAQLSQFTAV